MKRFLFIILLLLLFFNTSYAKVLYFSAGFSTQMSLESFSLFKKMTGTVLDKLLSFEVFPILRNFQNNFLTRLSAFEDSAANLYESFQKNLNLLVKLYNGRNESTSPEGSQAKSVLDGLGPLLNSTHDLKQFLLELGKLNQNLSLENLDEAGMNVKKLLAHLGETAKRGLELKGALFEQLGEFGISSQDDFFTLRDEIITPGTVLNDALRQKLSPLFSTGFQGYFQLGLPIATSNFYYGFELGFGVNLGRMIMPNLNLLRAYYPVKLGLGIMPRLFVKYDIYYLAATIFSGFGDRSLVVDPIYVGNLIGNGVVTNPFRVIETGLRLRLAFLNLESSVLFSINDFKYRDLRAGLGFEIPIII
ncbi:hypothetical protein bcCo53_000540 [Borrelia coriaceae]|uniref:Uncharacterized protein n=1 Tax=Borrelia coriaceae ATCC 43381 TaxID=1408429 RepID=W5SU35_9SPIR|nr:hypothetical protein [Borrelia coriaceae]AHH10724.1 Hypothetical protein BCO_0061100 [Borrelia coriaceae ATCC 43381]UPA16395.1 hypothetical protein bcCo53_000540 [Borrelia coriaceae]